MWNSHTLRGCVDWNVKRNSSFPLAVVTPCVGVWIETIASETVQTSERVTPCVGVWIETLIIRHLQTNLSHTLRGCVDWNMLWLKH